MKLSIINIPKFSILIITYNSERYIKPCLDSVYSQDFDNYEVILIDNASVDKTLDIVQAYENLQLEVNNINKGFPAALNKGIRLSKGEYILTLNPDVILEPNFLTAINKKIRYLPDDVGMIGVKILKDRDKRRIDSTGLILSKAVRFFDRGSGEIDSGQYDSDINILGPCAAAAVYKKDMLEDIRLNDEYFDSIFFHLIEDFDVALRARYRGWKSIYIPDGRCYHARNGCGMKRRYRQYLSFRNRYFLMIKNTRLIPCHFYYFLIYDIPRLFVMLIINFRYTIKAIFELCYYFRTTKKEILCTRQ